MCLTRSSPFRALSATEFTANGTSIPSLSDSGSFDERVCLEVRKTAT
jgi:hypothetical protein